MSKEEKTATVKPPRWRTFDLKLRKKTTYKQEYECGGPDDCRTGLRRCPCEGGDGIESETEDVEETTQLRDEDIVWIEKPTPAKAVFEKQLDVATGGGLHLDIVSLIADYAHSSGRMNKEETFDEVIREHSSTDSHSSTLMGYTERSETEATVMSVTETFDDEDEDEDEDEEVTEPPAKKTKTE